MSRTGFRIRALKPVEAATLILSRDHWTTLSFRARRDIIRLGVDEDALAQEIHCSLLRRDGVSLKGLTTLMKQMSRSTVNSFGDFRAGPD